MEPLESAAVARRRNARSSARRGIDSGISRERRRRTRSPGGFYHLDVDGGDGNDESRLARGENEGGAVSQFAVDDATGARPASESGSSRPSNREPAPTHMFSNPGPQSIHLGAAPIASVV